MENNRNNPKTRLAVVWENLETGELENVSPVLRHYLTESMEAEPEPSHPLAETSSETGNGDSSDNPRNGDNRPDRGRNVDEEVATGLIDPTQVRRRPFFFEQEIEDNNPIGPERSYRRRYILASLFLVYVIVMAFLWVYFHRSSRTM